MNEPTGPDAVPRRRGANVDLQVGSRLRIRRGQAGLSRPELAEALGVSVRQLRAYEDGTVRVSAAMLVRAANVLGSAVLDFFANVARQPGSVAHKDSPGKGYGPRFYADDAVCARLGPRLS